MKKNIIIILFSFFASLPLFSQVMTLSSAQRSEKDVFVARKKTIIDTCVLKIQYRMFYVKDVKNPDKIRSYYMELQIGKRMSKFSDFQKLKIDSLLESYEKQKMDGIEAINKVNSLYRGTTNLNIFKDYPKNKITVADRISVTGVFKYVEEKTKPIWKMKPGSSTVCGYACKKATTTFRGRNYTAWYTSKIPYSDGPWKFWGLPGLILKISDDKNEYSFECAAIEKPRKTENIYINQLDYFNTTRKRFNITEKNAYSNIGPLFESMGIKIDGKSIGNKSIPYNPIELSE